MSDILNFIQTNPWMTIVLLIFLFSVIAIPFETLRRVAIRKLRSNDIRARGWPPPGLDADGDFYNPNNSSAEDP
ncbi:MAG TPA: hypothetical protein VN081_02525 [Dongiaceae bacterium]|nr:hypothetical protein [Dongiaceae bacterium]